MYTRVHHMLLTTVAAGARSNPRTVILTADGAPLAEAWHFQASPPFSSRSPAWHYKTADGIGLLYDFYVDYRDTARFREGLSASLLPDFAHHVTSLTLNTESCLSICERRKKNVLAGVRMFAIALYGNRHEPYIAQSQFAQAILRSWEIERQKQLPDALSLAKLPANATVSAKSFPDHLIQDFMLKGCKLDRRKPQETSWLSKYFSANLLMSLTLLFGGGIRISNLFHIWMEDVRDEVYLYHPINGVHHRAGNLKITRQAVLNDLYGLKPRNLIAGQQRAGWKSLAIDERDQMRSQVYWASARWKKTFYELFTEYRSRIAPKTQSHPYLFSSLSGKDYGNPWTVGAFRKSYNAALLKLGISGDAYPNTNPHSIRHHFGHEMKHLGLPLDVLQRTLHHASIESSAVYTVPSPTEINNAINLSREHRFNLDEQS